MQTSRRASYPTLAVIEALDRLSEAELGQTAIYGARCRSVRAYGRAALIQLGLSSREGLPLAVWVHGDVLQAASFDAWRRAMERDRTLVLTPPLPWIVVRGAFARHPWAARLSIDVTSRDDVLMSFSAAEPVRPVR